MKRKKENRGEKMKKECLDLWGGVRKAALDSAKKSRSGSVQVAGGSDIGAGKGSGRDVG